MATGRWTRANRAAHRADRAGRADYTKGNAFHELEFLRTMPRARLFGNALLSLVSKLASGTGT
jgi:hypothetical protein